MTKEELENILETGLEPNEIQELNIDELKKYLVQMQKISEL